MAMQVQSPDIGVDVSKVELVCAAYGDNQIVSVANDKASIKRWLKTLPDHSCLAVEATSYFHMELVEQAWQMGFAVYVVNGYQLSQYRKSIGGRAKTDTTDARLLARYLNREKDSLRRWTPPPKAYRNIQMLLNRRACLVRARVALKQSFETLPQARQSTDALIRHMNRLEKLLEKQLRTEVRNAGWSADVRRVQAIEGIGPINAIALVMAFQRGEFRSSDSFVAFLGLDVRARDSGTCTGKRKLTKQGSREIRRLLHNAAMAARKSSVWEAFYQRHRARGLATTQALVVLARKLVRIAFALLRNQTEYRRAQA